MNCCVAGKAAIEPGGVGALTFEGHAAVPKWQISRWYGQERFSIGIRRDVRDRWAELSSELPWIKDKKLLFAEVKGQIVLMHDQIFFRRKRIGLGGGGFNLRLFVCLTLAAFFGLARISRLTDSH